jgi:hypothetical protein
MKAKTRICLGLLRVLRDPEFGQTPFFEKLGPLLTRPKYSGAFLVASKVLLIHSQGRDCYLNPDGLPVRSLRIAASHPALTEVSLLAQEPSPMAGTAEDV